MGTKRGISPMLSVIILLGISVVGGGLLYNVQSQILTTGLSTMSIKITELSMIKDAEGGCYFNSKLYNSGTEEINKIDMKLTLDSGEDFHQTFDNFGDTLIPGNSTQITLFLSSGNFDCGNFTTSNIYSARINATSEFSSFSTIYEMQVEDMS